MTKVEMVRWHHPLYGHEFKQAPGVLAALLGVAKSQTRLSYRATANGNQNYGGPCK